MAEGQVLFDPIKVGGSEKRRLAQRPAALGAFALQQMAPAGPAKENFPVRGYLEAFHD